MPRLPTSLVLRAHAIDPLLPLLLKTCRDLHSARNELRWLREHVQTNHPAASIKKSPTPQRRTNLHQICVERGRGKPLQYILGSQPFGDLHILCKPGVLIPRPETEAYTTHLTRRLLRRGRIPRSLRILDLCTGTGCIPLLLSSLLTPHIPSLRIHGIDISSPAIALARKNLHHNITQRHLRAEARTHVVFKKGDVLTEEVDGEWDIMISNPPYISPASFRRDTARSVRNYEPHLALVPPPSPSSSLGMKFEGGDVFYPRLLSIADKVNAKLVLMEVADMTQAVRVAVMVRRKMVWEGCEIWRDWTGLKKMGHLSEWVEVDGKTTAVIGGGNGRVVVCWRGQGGKWKGRARASSPVASRYPDESPLNGSSGSV